MSGYPVAPGSNLNPYYATQTEPMFQPPPPPPPPQFVYNQFEQPLTGHQPLPYYGTGQEQLLPPPPPPPPPPPQGYYPANPDYQQGQYYQQPYQQQQQQQQNGSKSEGVSNPFCVFCSLISIQNIY